MDQDTVMLEEYKVCQDGYMTRDGLVPSEFSDMLRTFFTLLAISAAFKVLMSYEPRFGSVLFLLTATIGVCCLFAFAVNIEAKASSKRALRKRMVEIEEYFQTKSLKLEYWKSIVQREKYWIESHYKDQKGERNEKGSAARFFVYASRFLVIVWVVLQLIMFFGNIDLPRFHGN